MSPTPLVLRLREWRRRHKVTQATAARLLDVTGGLISLWETQKVAPRDGSLAAIELLISAPPPEGTPTRDPRGGGTPSATLGERLRGWRELHGRSRREVARALKCSPATITAWETGGKRPGTRYRKRLVQLFGGEIEVGAANEDPEVRAAKVADQASRRAARIRAVGDVLAAAVGSARVDAGGLDDLAKAAWDALLLAEERST